MINLHTQMHEMVGKEMLLIADRLRDLNFEKLMTVYSEGNYEKAAASVDFSEGIIQAEQDFFQYLNQVFFRTQGAFYAVWVENGEYCSALRMEPYRDGMLLEALETAPHMRKKGYASKLIKEVLLFCRHQKVYSHVQKQNRASLATHEVCGFEVISDYAVYADGSVLPGSYTLFWKFNEKTQQE